MQQQHRSKRTCSSNHATLLVRTGVHTVNSRNERGRRNLHRCRVRPTPSTSASTALCGVAAAAAAAKRSASTANRTECGTLGSTKGRRSHVCVASYFTSSCSPLLHVPVCFSGSISRGHSGRRPHRSLPSFFLLFGTFKRPTAVGTKYVGQLPVEDCTYPWSGDHWVQPATPHCACTTAPAMYLPRFSAPLECGTSSPPTPIPIWRLALRGLGFWGNPPACPWGRSKEVL